MIGQGAIVYGASDEIVNYVTTLADSVRVSDDFGKFRFQYEHHEPWIGMHGSFVVCSNIVERLIGFDHGVVGSITEDAYFALAARAVGVQFAWIDATMYEQSPFTLMDFVRQRSRWFLGLWLIMICKDLPLERRNVLGLMMISWAFTPFVCLAIYTSWLVNSTVSLGFSISLATVGALALWGYLLGFWFTFNPNRIGWTWFACLMVVQMLLLPVFALMETAGVVHGVYQLTRHSRAFYIVKKEESSSEGDAEEIEMSSISSADNSPAASNVPANLSDLPDVGDSPTKEQQKQPEEIVPERVVPTIATFAAPVQSRMTLKALNCARYLASIQIVMFHDGVTNFEWGQIWTTFFFILSGFVLTYAKLTSRNPSKPDPLFQFLKRRLVTIYPLFGLVFVFGVWVSVYVSFITPTVTDGFLFLGALLLQHSWYPYTELLRVIPWYMPTWFISALFWYWLFFGPLYRFIRSRSIGQVWAVVIGCIVYGCALIVGCALDQRFLAFVAMTKFFPIWYVHFFVAGMAYARIYLAVPVEEQNNRRWLKYGASFVVVTYLILVFTVDESDVIKCFKYSICVISHGLLTMSLASGCDPLSKIMQLPFLDYLGNLSYPQYIIHPLLLALCGSQTPRGLVWMLLVGVSWLCHIVIVKPTTRWLQPKREA
eukprot:c8927_g1_i2.p1 GENE.c8927_g1_i2~~c8927_g1_i2.p1  ORF type:complete len:656 (-),score=147.65 c8927_g1_i2:34-2001(-)